MTFTVWGSLALSAIAIILIPLLALLFRLAMGATRLTDRVSNIESDLSQMVADIKDERRLMDRRVRWLEQNLWRYFRNGHADASKRHTDPD